MTRASLGLLMLLAACSPAPDTSTSNAPPAATQPPAATPTPSPAADAAPVTLAGHWRVAGIDGAPLTGDYGLALSGNDTMLWWDPACAGYGIVYRIEGTRFITPPPPADNGEGRMVCEIGIPLELEQAWSALLAADRIVGTPSNGIELSGGGHSLLLYSQ